MKKKEIISYIKNHYPIESTITVAGHLNLNPSTVRRIAQKNHIQKSKPYLDSLKVKLIEDRRKWYELNIPDFIPTHLQEQLIFGSLLGDGYISKGAQRSLNFYYQEHFGDNHQREYRKWKLEQLKNLGFSLKGNFLRSTSHPYFTNLYPMLYQKGEKVITSQFLSKCTHPMFLTALYLDDGSLVLSYKLNKTKNIVYCHPSICIYTLSFSPEENAQLASHLNMTFGTNFVVSGHPDGKTTLLKINSEKDVRKFLEVIGPYTKEITAMKYKTDLDEKLKRKTDTIRKTYGSNVKITLSSTDRKNPYSQKEVNEMIYLKQAGFTDQAIANHIGRTYWSVVYKFRELREKGIF